MFILKSLHFQSAEEKTEVYKAEGGALPLFNMLLISS
jgi:hypothetical protein